MEELIKGVGLKIREARKAKGLTQKELGEKLGVSEPTVNKYEKGKINPSLEVLGRIAKELGLVLDVNFK